VAFIVRTGTRQHADFAKAAVVGQAVDTLANRQPPVVMVACNSLLTAHFKCKAAPGLEFPEQVA